jgi:hypothetical protein
MITRYAEFEELPLVFAMYVEALEEIGEKVVEQKALDMVVKCWSKAPCILLEKDGEIVGFSGLNTMDIPYNDMVVLRDYMFYIQPAHRGIRSWRTLCKAVKDVADNFKIPFVGEHLLTGDYNHHLRLIRMAGAKPRAIQAIYGGINE